MTYPSHEQFERDHAKRHPTSQEGCYACKLNGINLQFTMGKEDFHGPTIKERQDAHIADLADGGKVMGRDYEPAGARWI